MVKKFSLIVSILFLLLLSSSANAIFLGGWEDWGGPEHPSELPELGCYNDSGEYCGNTYIHNETPPMGQIDVAINPGGVETCINITIDDGCLANITFQWLNYSLYFDIWLEWANSQNWFDPDGVNYSSEPTWDNDSLWHTYYNESLISHSQRICANNSNVTCQTENNWASTYFDWRVVANFVCGKTTYNQTCYYYFEAEECDINYIYPSSPNGTVCPCCDSICINITNEYGNPMNVTIYANDTINETYYEINKYNNITDGKYCFCICGHVDDIFYPIRYNEVYHWYANITDTITGEQTDSEIFQFTTVSDPILCPCGLNDIRDIIDEGFEEEEEEDILAKILEEKEMIAIIFFLLAIGLLLLGLLVDLFGKEEDEKGYAALTILIFSVILFFVSAAAWFMAGTDYYAYGWLGIGLGLIALVFCFLGALAGFDKEE